MAPGEWAGFSPGGLSLLLPPRGGGGLSTRLTSAQAMGLCLEIAPGGHFSCSCPRPPIVPLMGPCPWEGPQPLTLAWPGSPQRRPASVGTVQQAPVGPGPSPDLQAGVRGPIFQMGTLRPEQLRCCSSLMFLRSLGAQPSCCNRNLLQRLTWAFSGSARTGCPSAGTLV